MELHKKIVVGVIAVVAMVGLPGDKATAEAPREGRTVTVPTKPCKYEDSRNCFWDAGVRGNGKGHSFWVNKQGRVTYLDARKGR